MKNKSIFLKFIGLLSVVLVMVSCDDPLPKPKAMLRLEYEKSGYEKLGLDDCPYVFEKNKSAKLAHQNGCSVNLEYPQLNGTIYVSYKKVDGNVKKLLSDVQKLTYEHVVKASAIVEQPYVDSLHQKYGMFYEVSGNAASQSQFYLTDSTSHFITGSIYFNSKPNYDSILPAAVYLREDVRKIMESLRWK